MYHLLTGRHGACRLQSISRSATQGGHGHTRSMSGGFFLWASRPWAGTGSVVAGYPRETGESWRRARESAQALGNAIY